MQVSADCALELVCRLRAGGGAHHVCITVGAGDGEAAGAGGARLQDLMFRCYGIPCFFIFMRFWMLDSALVMGCWMFTDVSIQPCIQG